ncbi:competence/damage-inducible protein cinA [Carnobacterium iners]|uniref:Putative competence-damage inducible protein n=1 Tax=Carnobacterium iners TaxID=1073423 RepID=A0A1X7NQZ5_9LACT|nr:competence/damage-inducible protein A [Carnobacterium iners]SEK26094.1 competence/damage-inducible protein cinA [Carnobacterium iners]SMH40430.1 competence/damage-inducible protein cinA [Carnobacterium iners]
MNAEIIAIGTELLLGQVVNTNATFLSKELATLGIEVYHQSVVGDNPKRLKEAIELAEKRSELVILTGGLGPTKDDVTKQVVAEHLGKELVIDEAAMKKIRLFHKQRKHPMTENNQLQALIIEGSVVLKNNNGLAVGMFLNLENQSFLLLPGPPHELEKMFEQEVKPLLLKQTSKETVLLSRVLRFYGIGESRLVTLIDDLIENQLNPTLASYTGKYEVSLRLTANGSSNTECEKKLDNLEAIIRERAGDYIYGYGDDNSLVEVVSKLIKEKKLTLSAAESLTGGAFQSMLTSTSGASEFFEGGLVTYSNRIKEEQLNVDRKIIDQFGVVSSQCAIKMAENVRQLFNSDIGISFTGVAGPLELENKKPGTVWIGIAVKNKETYAKCFNFEGDRNKNRELSVLSGLHLIYRDLLD